MRSSIIMPTECFTCLRFCQARIFRSRHLEPSGQCGLEPHRAQQRFADAPVVACRHRSWCLDRAMRIRRSAQLHILDI